MSYAVLGAWLLTWPTMRAAGDSHRLVVDHARQVIDPFHMALAPYWQPGAVDVGRLSLFHRGDRRDFHVPRHGDYPQASDRVHRAK